jgi:hypothetical protein
MNDQTKDCEACYGQATRRECARSSRAERSYSIRAQAAAAPAKLQLSHQSQNRLRARASARAQ